MPNLWASFVKMPVRQAHSGPTRGDARAEMASGDSGHKPHRALRWQAAPVTAGPMADVFDHPFLGGLFADPDAQAPWRADAQLAHYVAFEAALSRALGAAGLVDKVDGEAAAEAIEAAEIDPSVLRSGAAQDGLPIPAFVKALRAAAEPYGAPVHSAVHTGATSQDVMDTALALTLRQVTNLATGRLASLVKSIDSLLMTHGPAPLMGRTRMQAALPITVADRLRIWRAPLPEHAARLEALRPKIERLQLGGPVGTNAAFGDKLPQVQAAMARTLNLHVAPHVWHADRTVVADYASVLALISGSLGKIGQDVALMAQQGTDAAGLSGGGASSAMPHKSNPILAELLVTLAQYNAVQSAALQLAVVHEQERSGSAWALEWMVLPGMAVATCRALGAAVDLCGQITRLGDPDPA